MLRTITITITACEGSLENETSNREALSETSISSESEKEENSTEEATSTNKGEAAPSEHGVSHLPSTTLELAIDTRLTDFKNEDFSMSKVTILKNVDSFYLCQLKVKK